MDAHTLKKELIYTAILLPLLSVCSVASNTGFSGDEGDGSRAVWVHNILLVDEQGEKITPDDDPLLPFSTRQTCGLCHDYDKISRGWHFNATEPNIAAGRVGQPWIFTDAAAVMQIPLSHRAWPGAFDPGQLGLTNRQFIQTFARQMPGGGAGKLEINCMACHDADPAHNQAEYAYQIARRNFRWAAAATCPFASVSGSAKDMPNSYDYLTPNSPKGPTIKYDKNAFDHKNQVFFDIVRKIPAKRCYFCHSNYDITEDSPGRWARDEDVHLNAGLTCVNCHRNGLDHNIIRGYEGEELVSENPLAAASSCITCHENGRLGAPVPKHPGLPPVHFDKLTCTACHSGPWPEQKTIRTKTSRAHALGTYNVNKSADVLPHIIYPVFAKQPNGKIGPHKLVWPAFWAGLKGQKVTPIDPEIVKPIADKIIDNKKLPVSGNWPSLATGQIKEILKLLQATPSLQGQAVYICGGRLHRLDDKGKLIAIEHNAAKPYLWPIAHYVRPAAQSLGARRCEDCHSTDAPFFFAEIEVDTPLACEKGIVKKMIEFQELNAVYTKLFAFSFVFRPVLKVVSLCSSAILAIVLLLYTFRALACIAKALVGRNQQF